MGEVGLDLSDRTPGEVSTAELESCNALATMGCSTLELDAESVDVSTMERRIESLTTLLKNELSDGALLSPQSFESGLVAIAEDTPERTVECLANHDIRRKPSSNPDGIGLSVHGFNTAFDIQRFLSVYRDNR